MPATAAPHRSLTLDRDARSNGSYACRVVVIDDFTPKKIPIWANTNNNFKQLSYIEISHADLVLSKTNPKSDKYNYFSNGDLRKARIDLENEPAIVNISWSPAIALDKNGNLKDLKDLKDSTLPLTVVAGLINKFIDRSFPKDKIPTENDIRLHQSSLLELVYKLNEPKKTDNNNILKQKIGLQTSINYLLAIKNNGNLVINSAMNDGPKNLSVLSLIPGVVTVAAKGEKPNTYASYSSIGPSGSTVFGNGTIKVGDITHDPKSASGYSVTLADGKLVTPVYFSAEKPDGQALQPFSPTTSMITKINSGIGRIPIIGTSFAAPERADAASEYCNTLTETNPAKRLADTRDWLLQQGNGR
jgi:hypothetical protein